MTGMIIGVLLVVAVLVVVLLVLLGRARAAEDEARAALRVLAELQAAMPGIRRQAIAQSRSVVTGKVAEQFVPFIEGFGFNPRDCRFIGSPIDLVVFDGLTAGALERVVFVEVKTGSARLSQRERAVRNAIDAQQFAFLVCRVDDHGAVEWLPVRGRGGGR